MVRRLLPAALATLLLLTAAVPADGAVTRKKAIWGPVTEFDTYRTLGAGIYQAQIRWDASAPTPPAEPRNPADPAYRWPSVVDTAIAEGARTGIDVSVQIYGTPSWANGGRSHEWAPKRPRDVANFFEAAARRYPTVRLWLVWNEPARTDRWRPLVKGKKPNRKVIRRYAHAVDGVYSRLKRLHRGNKVIAGNTYTVGVVPPRKFIKLLKLRSGKPPRMDMWGHNPFSLRRPDLSSPPLGSGYADFSDLDQLAKWLDTQQRRRGARRLRLFLSEYCAPTDKPNREFNFYVSRETQASWLRSALRISRRWKRIHTLGTFLRDEAPRPAGDEVNRGLQTWTGEPKPSFEAFRRG